MRTKLSLALVPVLALLALAPAAFAHAKLSPPLALAGQGQVFTLAVPTEKDGLKTTEVEVTPPKGFSIDSFVPAPGWKRTVTQAGAGEDAVIEKVTWSGGAVPTGEDAVFQFLGRSDGAGNYPFAVRQTYSDGSVVDWSGPEDADAPAPVVQLKDSLGGGTPLLTYVALVLAAFAVGLAAAALMQRGGRREGGRPLA